MLPSVRASNQLAQLYWLERSVPRVPAIRGIEGEIGRALDALALPSANFSGRSIAVTAGSRGIASFREAVRGICSWLKRQGAHPFVVPAMGSHGGATAAGQRQILAGYGVTPDFIGAEVVASMETVSLGRTPEGFETFMDRAAADAGGILVLNRIKPHTSFSGKIESGLLKMIAVGLGKAEGAREFHRLARRHGWEPVLRAMADKAIGAGKVIAGVGLIENQFHEVCSVRAARAEAIPETEEEALLEARALVPRFPFEKLDLLVVDEIGKNVSGTGMDTKVIGRGVALAAGEAPEIRLIYARDLTAKSQGNALGVGLADFISERLYRRADLEKTYINVRTSLNFPLARLPMYFPNDRAAIESALAALGGPGAATQRLAWIRNTQRLNCLLVSEAVADELRASRDWRVLPEAYAMSFDADGNLISPLD